MPLGFPAITEALPRLPFGLPGVNKAKKVSNGNYLWISYFWSYLNPKGRAGFVMSSQASSAGNDEKEVRRKIIETGGVDVMISIRGGFFYTRTVPCELWHFDRNKPADRKDKVLMLDARGIGQLMKGSRKVYEFTPEQLKNIAAIIWLYRGQRDRFLALVKGYFARLCAEAVAVPEKIAAFDTALGSYALQFAQVQDRDPVAEPLTDLCEATRAYKADRTHLLADLTAFAKATTKSPPATNDKQRAARKAFDPLAERIKGLIKQVDLLYKFVSRVLTAAAELPGSPRPSDGRGVRGEGNGSGEGRAEGEPVFDLRNARKLAKDLDEQRHGTAEQLKHAAYFHRQIVWLQDRFPDAEICAVPGLAKVVAPKEIENADWSLTPGRYVGVAPAEVDENFDFEQAITDIHTELASLNEEARELASTIQTNLASLSI